MMLPMVCVSASPRPSSAASLRIELGGELEDAAHGNHPDDRPLLVLKE
ncbi:MAG: hypothetical protein HYY47_07710 [Deltaproteobacteria bacterium]|nr:hypothetical protein [Deltaproteobacteria bacterium]